MDWADNDEQAAFRNQVRDFIRSRLPALYRERTERGGGAGFEALTDSWVADRRSSDAVAVTAARDWADALGERGWVAPHWPAEYGGGGLTPVEQFIYNQEMATVGAPMVGGMQGVQMFGPTVIVHGTEQQKREVLPRILSGEVAWAQGYSEPGAGSDLASLQTRAVRDGDRYVINGQKIWTSNAHQADWIFALVRTDPDAPKHRGISLLYFDITTPGVSVRPLVNAGWEHHFNETFYEDVIVPASQRVGDENRGWYVAMTLLDFERSNIAGAVRMRRELAELVAAAQADVEGQSRLSGLPSLRAEVAERYIEAAVGENFSFRIVSMQAAGIVPNYEASTSKVFMSEVGQRLAQTGTKVFGLYANLWDDEDPRAPVRAAFTRRYVHTIGSTIGGGTSEVQRNIIATRGLGLPRG